MDLLKNSNLFQVQGKYWGWVVQHSVSSSAEEQQPVRHNSRSLRSEYKQGSPSSMELRVGGLGICYISF